MPAWTPRTFPMRYPLDDTRLLDASWFCARIEELGGTTPESYRFVEMEQDRTTNLPVEKEGGVYNTLPASPGGTDASPAYAIDGGTYAVDDIVFVRRSQSALPNWDIRGPGMPRSSVDWCADYTTQEYSAVLTPNPADLDGYGYLFNRSSASLEGIANSEGNASNDYKTGQKFYLIYVTDENTGRPYTTVCIPANSGEWVIRWGVYAGFQNSSSSFTSSTATFLWLSVAAQLAAVDESGVETTYTDGLGQVIDYVPYLPIRVLSGQVQLQDDSSLLRFGDVAGAPYAYTTFPGAELFSYFSGSVGGNEKRIVSGNETIRLAIKLDVRWQYNAEPDVLYSVGSPTLFQWGKGGCYLSIEQVSTDNCVGCGSGSGSGSSESPSCCDEELIDHPDLLLSIPDGTYVGDYTAVWGGSGWRFTIDDTTGGEISCSAGVWTLLGFPAEAQSCDPLMLSFDGSILGATTDITVSVAP